jgi:hypothetical protein
VAISLVKVRELAVTTALADWANDALPINRDGQRS